MMIIPVLLVIILALIIFVIFNQMIKSNPRKLKKADDAYMTDKMHDYKPNDSVNANAPSDESVKADNENTESNN